MCMYVSTVLDNKTADKNEDWVLGHRYNLCDKSKFIDRKRMNRQRLPKSDDRMHRESTNKEHRRNQEKEMSHWECSMCPSVGWAMATRIRTMR